MNFIKLVMSIIAHDAEAVEALQSFDSANN